MRVVVAKSAGFCWGVTRALRKARDAASHAGEAVYTDGPLIHNEELMDRLRREGIREVDDPRELREGTLVIRAHGVPPERRAVLSRLPLHLIDATCPDVARIQKLAETHAARGCWVLIFGDRGHAEVEGLLGFAGARARVIECVADVDSLPEINPVCLLSQSTQSPSAYRAVAEAVRKRFPDAVVLDTICRSTRNRQTELETMARGVDMLVVVGGAHSANTLRLAEIGRALKPTVLVQRADQIDPADFAGCRAVGLTAGASTPDFVIEAVRQRLERIQP